MSEGVESYFGPIEEDNKTNYIPPDYSSDESDDDFDEEATTEDEGVLETLENEQEQKEFEPRKEMISTPFSDSGSNHWSGGSNNPSSPWSQQQNSGSSIWGNSKPSWGSGSSNSWGSSFGGSTGGNQKQEIPRQKSVVFCDLLDCLLETYQSNGLPGLKPRGIYDLKPRFNVWEKIAAFNPTKVFALVPPGAFNTANGSDGWQVTMAYWCCCLSDFLGIPYTNCQVLNQTIIGQPKGYAILQAIQDQHILRPDAVYVGIYSGVSGQSDKDIQAARTCEIDYIDLNTLLNSMI